MKYFVSIFGVIYIVVLVSLLWVSKKKKRHLFESKNLNKFFICF